MPLIGRSRTPDPFLSRALKEPAGVRASEAERNRGGRSREQGRSPTFCRRSFPRHGRIVRTVRLVDRTSAFRAGPRLSLRRSPRAPTALVVAGGVAANGGVRRGLQRLATESGLRLVAPPLALCGDNGAMIAWAGLERLRLGLTDDLDAPARARWPLATAPAPDVATAEGGT